MRFRPLVLALATTFLATPAFAAGADAGLDAMAEAEGGVTPDAGEAPEAGAEQVACDGGLCDTSNGSTCTIAHEAPGSNRPADPIVMLGVVGLVALVIGTRRPGRR